MKPADVIKLIKDKEVKYADLRFTDTRGKEQHVTIPANLVDEELFRDGKMFDGSSIAGWKGINESDMILGLDPTTAVIDPFFEQTTINLRCDIIEPATMRRATTLSAFSVRVSTARRVPAARSRRRVRADPVRRGLPVAPGDRFVLRDPGRERTVVVAEVLDVEPSGRGPVLPPRGRAPTRRAPRRAPLLDRVPRSAAGQAVPPSISSP